MNSERTIAALGLFDGVHKGHRSLLDIALAGKKEGLKPAVFTFMPNAVRNKKGGGDGFIYTAEEKEYLLKKCGAELIYSPAFEEMRDMSGEDFVKNILCDRMNVSAVCCGEDFRFGKSASCGIDELRNFGRKYGFRVIAADTVLQGDTVISSGKIRKMLLDGETEKAAEFLGRPYTIFKKVTVGNQLGRTIGFPTANQVFEEGQLVPKYGVYASDVAVDGKKYRGMTNIGMKPTVNYGGMPLAETFIIGLSQNLYGTAVQTELKKFIRPEKTFSSLDELKKQIENDISEAEMT